MQRMKQRIHPFNSHSIINTMKKSDFAIIGLGTMGAALACNVESRGYTVSIYNRDHKKTQIFLAQHEGNFTTEKDYNAFIKTIARPRKILLMVKAGDPVDDVIADILPHLNKEDIIIDGGNSYYKDTQRREQTLKIKGIHFVGMGVSGGEEGALLGPSLMPGGSKESWEILKLILNDIAAKDFYGNPCVTHIGPDGSGHYVKMVHNGIEYAVMQLMAELYDIYRHTYKQSAPQIAKIFAELNTKHMKSFLFEIGSNVLNKQDETTKIPSYLVDNILDKAAQKGTGKWTSQDALDRGIAVPTITDAVFGRYISSEKKERISLAKQYNHRYAKPNMSIKDFTPIAKKAIYAALISSYAQGYDLITKTAAEEQWKINLAEMSRIWQGGCIIRAELLRTLHQAYKQHKTIHPLAQPALHKKLKTHTQPLRQLVSLAVESGVPAPAFATSLSYLDAMTTEQSPANFIQGLRDYFGAHTYERTDKKGTFHTEWTNT